MGVDYFIVTDNNSVDGTPGILQDFANEGLLHLINEKEDNYSQSAWVTRMARLAKSRFDADWIINGDADEFWYSPALDLKFTLSHINEEISVVRVPRYDYIPIIDSEKSIFHRMIIRDNKPKNHTGRPLPPKMCHRAFEEVIIDQGNHNVTYPADLKSTSDAGLEIFHFPIRSWKQFSDKIIYGGAAYARNSELPPNIGDGWRRLYQFHLNGTLMDYFQSKILSNEEIQKGVETAKYSEDPRLRDYLVSKKIIENSK